MTANNRLILLFLSLSLLLSAVSCADMGVGEDETAFYDYFSFVYLISPEGGRATFIHQFNPIMSLEDTEEIKEVVPPRKYAYIAFCVAEDHTLAVDEFAFFFKGAFSNDAEADMGVRTVMDFYISDRIPTKLQGASGSEPVYLPDVSAGLPETGDEQVYEPETAEDGSVVERDDEADESMFKKKAYATAVVEIGNGWGSAHLAFDTPQTVKEGQFVVIRIRNNCVIEQDDSNVAEGDNVPLEAISFTFNHLMFRFGSVTKE